MSYNGWKNYQTWNVALWIDNDYGLYSAAVEFAEGFTENPVGCYREFIEEYWLENQLTPNNVHWLDFRLDYDALDEFMVGLCE